jgi:hypothetical protein
MKMPDPLWHRSALIVVGSRNRARRPGRRLSTRRSLRNCNSDYSQFADIFKFAARRTAAAGPGSACQNAGGPVRTGEHSQIVTAGADQLYAQGQSGWTMAGRNGNRRAMQKSPKLAEDRVARGIQSVGCLAGCGRNDKNIPFGIYFISKSATLGRKFPRSGVLGCTASPRTGEPFAQRRR